MKVLAILGICFFTYAYGGVVDTTSCGGVGTWRELRISTCQGAVCEMNPGTPYNCEGDFITSSASTSLSLKVQAVFLGTPITIIDTELPNSSVQPGTLYTVVFVITPNDVLSGQQLPVSAEVSRTGSGLIEACRVVQVRIL